MLNIIGAIKEWKYILEMYGINNDSRALVNVLYRTQ